VRRREFVTLLGDAAAAWPLAVRAQQRRLPGIALKSSQISSSCRRAQPGLGAFSYLVGCFQLLVGGD